MSKYQETDRRKLLDIMLILREYNIWYDQYTTIESKKEFDKDTINKIIKFLS